MIRATLTTSNLEAEAASKASAAAVIYGGTFSAGTVTLHARRPGFTAWEVLTGTAFDTVTSFVIDISPKWEIKAVLTSGDGSDAVEVSVDAVPTIS